MKVESKSPNLFEDFAEPHHILGDFEPNIVKPLQTQKPSEKIRRLSVAHRRIELLFQE